jgi:Kef-type K+ transport system membrane component KefB
MGIFSYEGFILFCVGFGMLMLLALTVKAFRARDSQLHPWRWFMLEAWLLATGALAFLYTESLGAILGWSEQTTQHAPYLFLAVLLVVVVIVSLVAALVEERQKRDRQR